MEEPTVINLGRVETKPKVSHGLELIQTVFLEMDMFNPTSLRLREPQLNAWMSQLQLAMVEIQQARIFAKQRKANRRELKKQKLLQVTELKKSKKKKR